MDHSVTCKRHWLLVVLLSAFVGGCGGPGLGAGPNSYGLDLSIPEEAFNGGAVIFIVDGINADIFHEMLTAGELPAIKKYFVDRGVYVRRASVNSPTVTTANLTTMVTGRAPGHHGVVAVRWFDRHDLIWRNYATIVQKNHVDRDYTAPTIFERLDDVSSYSLFCQPHRGATKFFENTLSTGPAFGLGLFEFVDRVSLSRFGEMAALARRRGEWPTVVVCYLLSPDFQAYAHGLYSPQYRRALAHTDLQIGRVMGDFDRAGLLDRLVFAFTSDHGMVNVTQAFSIEQFLVDECRLALARKRLWENTPYDNRLAAYEQDNVVVAKCGNRFASVSLRKPIRRDGQVVGHEPWPVRPSVTDMRAYPTEDGREIDLLSAFVAREEVFSVAFPAGENRARVQTADGVAQFDQPDGPGGDITYSVISGRDPLGWAEAVPAELLAGTPGSPMVWREATIGLDFADTPMQLPAYFRSKRAADIMVFCADEWDFTPGNHAGHGGMLAAEMHVPLLITGPSIPPGQQLSVASTSDLTPTILSLLGRPVPDDLDGVALPIGEVKYQAGP